MSAAIMIPTGMVSITRQKGRIAGFASFPEGVDSGVLVCGTNRPRKKFGRRANGWSFPPAVNEFLLQHIQGQTALHLFGGQAKWGVRLDLDPATNPHKLGDAFLAHTYFPRDSFDHVVIDPPYSICERCFQDLTLSTGKKQSSLVPAKRKQEILNLMDTAAFVAMPGGYVWWFHTIAIDTHKVLPMDMVRLVYCGGQCAVRILQRFKVLEPKRRPPDVSKFERGPALKYRRWANVEKPLPFVDVDYGIVEGLLPSSRIEASK